MTDKERRDKAVDAFAEAMKARLDEKAARGYKGWDGAYNARYLLEEVKADAASMTVEKDDRHAVDIANLCMMLWFRANKLKQKSVRKIS